MRVLLIDSHGVFREGLALALQSDYGFDVVHTGRLTDVAALVRGNPVQVVVIACDVRVQTAAEFIGALRSIDFAVPVVVLAERLTDLDERDLVTDRVAALIFKHQSISVLADAIQRLSATGEFADAMDFTPLGRSESDVA
jgi:DNA-binding NarL/FixJ family response regulator